MLDKNEAIIFASKLNQFKMKKLFVLFAAATLFVGVQACKQKEEAATEETTEVTTEAPADSTATAAPADSTAKAAPAADSAKAAAPATK